MDLQSFHLRSGAFPAAEFQNASGIEYSLLLIVIFSQKRPVIQGAVFVFFRDVEHVLVVVHPFREHRYPAAVFVMPFSLIGKMFCIRFLFLFALQQLVSAGSVDIQPPFIQIIVIGGVDTELRDRSTVKTGRLLQKFELCMEAFPEGRNLHDRSIPVIFRVIPKAVTADGLSFYGQRQAGWMIRNGLYVFPGHGYFLEKRIYRAGPFSAAVIMPLIQDAVFNRYGAESVHAALARGFDAPDEVAVFCRGLQEESDLKVRIIIHAKNNRRFKFQGIHQRYAAVMNLIKIQEAFQTDTAIAAVRLRTHSNHFRDHIFAAGLIHHLDMIADHSRQQFTGFSCGSVVQKRRFKSMHAALVPDDPGRGHLSVFFDQHFSVVPFQSFLRSFQKFQLKSLLRRSTLRGLLLQFRIPLQHSQSQGTFRVQHFCVFFAHHG